VIFNAALLNNALPSLCAVCHSWGRGRVCQRCLTQFLPLRNRCAQCALVLPDGVPLCGACITHPPPYTRTTAGVDYVYPWDGLITRFKFQAALDLTATFSHLMQVAHGAQRPQLLLPMPLSAHRLRERGYNQAWELTRRLAQQLRCPAHAHTLLRIKDTPHQLSLPRDERAANVRGAFAVEPHQRARLQGQSITLVDDVMTTGATAAEAARTLLQAGATQVQVWVLARTPRPGDA
jgi:ComF family protein